MPNLDLKKKQFNVDDQNVRNYFGGNNSVTYEYLNKVKSELENKTDKGSNDVAALKWIDNNLKGEIDAVDAPKRIMMQTDGQGKKVGGNAYKDTHTKDRDNADPTRVRMPKVHKGSMNRQIMTNKVAYESVNDRIKDIEESNKNELHETAVAQEFSLVRYLIEYMDNNKQNK